MTGAGAVTLERETLNVKDARSRIVMVETRTQGLDPAPPQLIRYQIGTHLGSVSLELDHQSQIISYEEYFPYGCTSYQARRSNTETPKRYRFTEKERDEETGFSYHGARYYAPWLGRWCSADPLQLVDGVNLYRYARCNPILLIDPNGTDPVTSPVNTSDPKNFSNYKDYRAANPDQPEEAVRQVWYAEHGKKYLIIYDKGNDEFKRQAEQAARDHSTTAYAVDSKNLSDVIAKRKPDVIMSIGHGSDIFTSLSTGNSEWIGENTLKKELKEAKQSQEIRFVADACSVGAKDNLMDKLHKDPDLKNYTFVSHTDIGHPVRNPNVRVAGGTSLPAFMIDKLQGFYSLDKKSAQAVTWAVLGDHGKTKAEEREERGPAGNINTVIREISVLGFDDFWRLLNSSTDVKADPSVLSLNLTPEALERFAAGMQTLRTRLTTAVSKQTPITPLKPHATEDR